MARQYQNFNRLITYKRRCEICNQLEDDHAHSYKTYSDRPAWHAGWKTPQQEKQKTHHPDDVTSGHSPHGRIQLNMRPPLNTSTMAGLFTKNILGQQKPWPGCTKHSEFNHGRAEYEEKHSHHNDGWKHWSQYQSMKEMISITLADWRTLAHTSWQGWTQDNDLDYTSWSTDPYHISWQGWQMDHTKNMNHRITRTIGDKSHTSWHNNP